MAASATTASPRGGSRTTGRVILAASLVAGAVLLIVGVVELSKTDRGTQGRRLPDGASLALLGYTYGPQHRFLTGPRWQKLLWPVAPAPLRERLAGVREMWRYGNVPPKGMVLWMLRRPEARGAPFDGRHSMAALDEHGCELLVDPSAVYGAGGSGGLAAEPWAMDTFPRRGRTIGIRFYQSDGADRWHPEAEFRIPNPDPGPHPTWTAPPPPVRHVHDGVTFSLTGLVTGIGPDLKARPLEPGDAPWTRAAFRIEQGGRPAEDWLVETVKVSDATGNHWEPRISAALLDGRDRPFAFQGGLCPHEAYRLAVQFQHAGEPLPDELWTVRGVPIPPAGGTRVLSHSTTRGRIRVTLAEVFGPGAHVEPFPDRWTGPVLRLSIRPAEFWGRRVKLVRAIDAQGRNLLESNDPQAVGTDGEARFALKNRPGTRVVDLTFAIAKSHFLEFVARPALPPQ
jgi:hypothetical protein